MPNFYDFRAFKILIWEQWYFTILFFLMIILAIVGSVFMEKKGKNAQRYHGLSNVSLLGAFFLWMLLMLSFFLLSFISSFGFIKGCVFVFGLILVILSVFMTVHYWKPEKKMAKLKRKSRMIFWFCIGIFAFLMMLSLAAEKDYQDRKEMPYHKHMQKLHRK
ncbi:MAG: hypothetical protein K1060chlam5_00993 [Candidatus Anoxychlamydiales bacterium]|nr:hypothetical protein [Candidatus Anoxychlamydiales bacterium]